MEHNSTSDNSGKNYVLVFTLYIYMYIYVCMCVCMFCVCIYILFVTCVFDDPAIHFLNRGTAESVRRGRHK